MGKSRTRELTFHINYRHKISQKSIICINSLNIRSEIWIWRQSLSDNTLKRYNCHHGDSTSAEKTCFLDITFFIDMLFLLMLILQGIFEQLTSFFWTYPQSCCDIFALAYRNKNIFGSLSLRNICMYVSDKYSRQ